MNEKKLKKLNRLELLELLFEVSKENEQLKEENSELKRLLDNNSSDIKSATSLASSVKSLEAAVTEIKEISEKISVPSDSADVREVHVYHSSPDSRTGLMSVDDTELFLNILKLFRQKPFLASVLPDDIRKAVTYRINIT